jgi:hypothetical protein
VSARKASGALWALGATAQSLALCGWVWLAIGSPAHAAGIEGRVIHPERPDAGVGIPVRLLGVNRSGETHTEITRTGAEGRFQFRDLPAPAAYLLAADYEGLSFSGGSIVFEPDDVEGTRQAVIHVYDRSDDPTGLSIELLEWALEREAGVYRIRMAVRIENPTLRAVALDADAPAALRIGLLPGHGPLESPFAFGHSLPTGVKAVGDVVELRGPFFPGKRDIRLDYELESAGTLQVDLLLPDAIRMLDIRVRDFGVTVDAGPLHPARPGREADQVYLRFLGFDLEPGTAIPLSIQPLLPHSSPPRAALALMVALLGGGVMFWVLSPLRDAEAHAAVPAEPDSDDAQAALFTALADLEHDFETGKLSAEDRSRLRQDIRSEALRSLAAARAAEAPAEPPGGLESARADLVACDCGRIPQPEDRFCARCGKTL